MSECLGPLVVSMLLCRVGGGGGGGAVFGVL